MKKITIISMGLLLMMSLAFFGAGCFGSKESPSDTTAPITEDQTPTKDQIEGNEQLAEDTVLSNPATVYCLSQGGDFEMQKTLAGTTEGYCTLPSGIVCEVWAHYNGDCPEGARDDEEEDTSTTTTDMLASTSTTMAGTTSTSVITTTSTTIISDVNDSNDSSTDEITEETASTNEESVDSSSSSSVSTTGEKKKITGDIDIAVKPGEDTGELVLSWDPHELSAPNGYIVMLDSDENVTFSGSYTHELPREESFAFTWVELNPEKEYYFRVCIKEDDGCGTYSPVISGYPRAEE